MVISLSFFFSLQNLEIVELELCLEKLIEEILQKTFPDFSESLFPTSPRTARKVTITNFQATKLPSYQE